MKRGPPTVYDREMDLISAIQSQYGSKTYYTEQFLVQDLRWKGPGSPHSQQSQGPPHSYRELILFEPSPQINGAPPDEHTAVHDIMNQVNAKEGARYAVFSTFRKKEDLANQVYATYTGRAPNILRLHGQYWAWWKEMPRTDPSIPCGGSIDQKNEDREKQSDFRPEFMIYSCRNFGKSY